MLSTRSLLVIVIATSGMSAQTFNSGSNGSDGALNLTLPSPGVIEFDLSNPHDPRFGALDKDQDNVLHFTTITIGANVTLRMRAGKLRSKPIVWLTAGNVVIDGMIDLSGAKGSPPSLGLAGRFPAEPGPGGFPGGVGGLLSTMTSPPTSGGGPGGGSAAVARSSDGRGNGGGAGHARPGLCSPAPAGRTYGTLSLVPLFGGSGGGGGWGSDIGWGGGAGGGALRIASSGAITIDGSILSNGGAGRDSSDSGPSGGGGSGGAIHLQATQVAGKGTLSVAGTTGTGFGCEGSAGRIRIDAFTNGFTGALNPSDTISTSFGSPFAVPLPTTQSMIRIVSIGGVAVSPSPMGNTTTPDVTINSTSGQTIQIQAMNVPVGTIVKLYLFSEAGTDLLVDSTPLTGTLASSTATAQVTLPTGFSRTYVRAVWATP